MRPITRLLSHYSPSLLPRCSLVTRQDVAEGVRQIRLSDTKSRNALSLEMLQALQKEFTHASEDTDVRALVLTAESPVFSSGHNLKQLQTSAGAELHKRVFDTCAKLMQTIQDSRLPVVAAVNTHAAAAGCQLIASCDVVIAGESAKFSTPGVRFGLFCSTPGIAVARSVSRKVALDMLLTGEPINAQQALNAGLVSRVVPDDKAEVEAVGVAKTIAALPRVVIGLGKAFFYSQIESPRDVAYRLGEQVMLANLKLKDCQTGLDSFVAKKKPEWSHTDKKV